LRFTNEADGVGALDITDSLSEASKFVCARMFPYSFGLWMTDEMAIFHAGSGCWVDNGTKMVWDSKLL
jgi:hypothetical protein